MDRNGHKLKPLKKRLTRTQAFARRERIMNNGTYRQRTDTTLSQLAGLGNASMQAYSLLYGRHRYTRWGTYALAGAYAVDVVGRVVGWW